MPGGSPRVTAAMVAHGRGLSEPRLSPDGGRVAFVAVVGGRGHLVVVPATGGAEVVLTADPPVRAAPSYGGGAFDWLPDGGALVYAGAGGDLWRVPAAGGPSVRLTAHGDAAPAAAPAVSPDGRWVAYTVDQRDVAVAPTQPGGVWPVRVSGGGNDFAFDPAWWPDGGSVVWHEWDVPDMPWDAGRLVRGATDGSGVEVLVGGPAQVQQPRPGPDGRLAYLTDRTGWLNLTVDGVTVLDEPFEHGRPSWGQGQRSFAWSPDGRRLACCRNERGFGRLVVADRGTGTVAEVGRGVHGSLSWVGERLVALRSGARTPTEVVVYDTTTWTRTTVAVGPVGGWDGVLTEPSAVTWEADDGETVHGRLYLPGELSDHSPPPPMIVWIHGGPTDQWDVSFRPRIAYFVDRGWAVLVPDHRGSTGHGRAYTQAMRGGWGDLDVHDTAAGVRAAARNGWCDASRVAVMGGSAGGFTVLNLLAHHPHLFAAGVDLYGVTDLAHLAETTHRFEAHYLDSIVGPLPATAELYRRRSPVHLAERITAPLLILHGADDAVVPLAQSRAIADRLRSLGRTVELQVYEGEGHGWGRPDTVIDELARVEAFLHRHVRRWRA